MIKTAYTLPQDIEGRSFEIISQELGPTDYTDTELLVVKRVIHATADFDFAKTLTFSPAAAEAGIAALKDGAHIVCDTTMVEAGINKRALSRLGGATHAFVGDPDVAEEARHRHTTRSAIAMERAAALDVPTIFAIGNAPTALIRLCQMIEDKTIRKPALVIGVPVGFVNVVESKEALQTTDVDQIVATGRKGGSTVAVAIANALIYCATGGRRD